MTDNVSRRRFLGLAAGGAALGVTAIGVGVARATGEPGGAGSVEGAVPFEGVHQAGIVTPQQDRVQVTAFDVVTHDRDELRALLREWTDTARRLTAGLPVGASGAVDGRPDAPPDDTGEAMGLPPAGLTLTIGFGPSLFDDRFGLAARRPPALADLPHFAGDAIDRAISDGDLCIQACAYDAQVALHAIRQLTRIGTGVVAPRWSQLGYARTSGVGDSTATPRNLMGFKDGTRNLDLADATLLDEQLWAAAGDGAPWMAGGSYLVSRRIRMTIEVWDRAALQEQEAVMGRAKRTGAPLGAAVERDEPDFAATTSDGSLAIPATAHVRLAHPAQNGGAHLLRRGYNFTDGIDHLGRLDAGLFFLAYQRDPRRQFVPIQTRLAESDHLSEYLQHVSSGVYACPPGVGPHTFWGSTLFV